MKNFEYYNPVKIIFGRDTISKTSKLIPETARILITYGGGSIKKNGVYDQVKNSLKNHIFFEFGGIEANPDFDTLMKAVELVKKEKIDFLLSVGGGSVLDGTKFIAAAALYEGKDPWDLLTQKKTNKIEKALPIGAILTLPATGSEMNGFAVISRRETKEKLTLGSPLLFPKFSILDPVTTFTLDKRQTTNGIVDAYVHVLEQYITYDVNSPLQDRQSEALLKTLVDETPKLLKDPDNYDTRANIMWCATQALNGLVACGIIQDWTTHMIGHEITAFYGLDHAQSLAVILPAVLKHQKENKLQKFSQYGRRVWHIVNKGEGRSADELVYDIALEKTLSYFHQMDVKTKLSDYNITPENFQEIADRFDERKIKLGEHQNITSKEVMEILHLAL